MEGKNLKDQHLIDAPPELLTDLEAAQLKALLAQDAHSGGLYQHLEHSLTAWQQQVDVEPSRQVMAKLQERIEADRAKLLQPWWASSLQKLQMFVQRPAFIGLAAAAILLLVVNPGEETLPLDGIQSGEDIKPVLRTKGMTASGTMAVELRALRESDGGNIEAIKGASGQLNQGDALVFRFAPTLGQHLALVEYAPSGEANIIWADSSPAKYSQDQIIELTDARGKQLKWKPEQGLGSYTYRAVLTEAPLQSPPPADIQPTSTLAFEDVQIFVNAQK